MQPDLQALRQALMAKSMAISPQEPEPIDPAVMAQFGGQPPQEMPMDAPMDPGAMGMAAPLPPEAQLEIEKAKVKEMLKKVRLSEQQQAMEVENQARMQDIENEANELFAPKKSSSY